MAAKPTARRRLTSTAAAQADPASQPEIDAENDDENRVLKLLEDEFGKGGAHDWRVRVYKITNALGRRPSEGWLFDLDMEDLENLREKLATEEGPGRYRVRISKDRVQIAQYDPEILADMRPKTPPAAIAAQPQPAGDGMTPFERAVLTMMDRQETRHQELLARLASAQPNQLNSMEQIATLLKSVREIAGPENTGLQMFREGIAFAKEMIPKGEGDGGNAGFIDLAMTALEKLPAIMGQVQPQTQRQALPQPQPIPPPRAPGQPQTPPAATNGALPALPPEFEQLKDFLIAKAKEGADPALFADYTSRQLGEAGLAYLETVEDPLNALFASFPEMGPYRLWFEALFEAMEGDGKPTMQTQPQIRFQQIPDGPAGTRETLKLMRELVRQGKCDPDMRIFALKLVRRVPPKNWQGEIAAIFKFVQTKIRYTLDINGIETLQAPWVTLELKAGDCDDLAILTCCLLEILGHPCYLCAAGFDGDEAYSHVFVLVDPGGEGDVMALDTTEPHAMGWGPPAPSRFMVAPIEGS